MAIKSFETDADDAAERDSFNAAFHELGLRFHWDRQTYDELQKHSSLIEDRTDHYLRTRHPHLLVAYDAKFLIGAILEKKSLHRQQRIKNAASQPHFDWSAALGCEIGC